jgi:hypothetical protein
LLRADCLRAAFDIPIIIGLLSLSGLLSALLFECGRYFSWIAAWIFIRSRHRSSEE